MNVKIKPMNTVSKTFQKDGKWTEKPTKTEILVCVCGNKYIKTRDGQISCLKCA
ncbi:MAG: hypothetical protein AAB471_00560 [Patescibacteria group bacterium]